MYVKPPDKYPWQGRNNFNSGIFVRLKKLLTLNYKSPLLSSQFLPALKWLLKSSLTVYLLINTAIAEILLKLALNTNQSINIYTYKYG